MGSEIEDGMGFRGLLPSREDAMEERIWKQKKEIDRLRSDCEMWFHLAIEMFEWFSPDNLTMQAKQREWAAKLGIDMESLYGGQDDE